MGQCIAVVSGKGGTGKTSFTAGVGAALALSGLRVLCVDCDIGLRNLDIALGLSDAALLAAAVGISQKAVDLEAGGVGNHVAGGVGGVDMMLGEDARIGRTELDHEFLLVVVRHESNIHRGAPFFI